MAACTALCGVALSAKAVTKSSVGRTATPMRLAAVMLFGGAARVLADQLSISLAVLVVIDILQSAAGRVLVDRCSAANPCAFPANGYAAEPQGPSAVSRRDGETKP